MPLLRLDALGETPHLHGSADAPGPLLAEAARTGAGPIIVMVHGYKFVPGHPGRCPHGHILSLEERGDCWKALSWPRALGFGGGGPDEGLGVALGWNARGTIWRAYDRAAEAGAALAQAIEVLHTAAPHRPIHALAHSLGARVVLQALARLPERAVNRAILLAGAEFASRAEAALATPAGRAAEIVNVTSRENDLFDFLLERLIGPPRPGDVTLGHGLGERPGALTLQLDDPATLSVLRARGFPVAAPARRVCHWSAYLRPGVFDLYRALLRRPENLPLAALRAQLPERPQPRWSRLVAPARGEPALSFLPKAPS